MSANTIEPAEEREALTRIILEARYRNGRPPTWIVREAEATAEQILRAGFHAAAAA